MVPAISLSRSTADTGSAYGSTRNDPGTAVSVNRGE